MSGGLLRSTRRPVIFFDGGLGVQYEAQWSEADVIAYIPQRLERLAFSIQGRRRDSPVGSPLLGDTGNTEHAGRPP